MFGTLSVDSLYLSISSQSRFSHTCLKLDSFILKSVTLSTLKWGWCFLVSWFHSFLCVNVYTDYNDAKVCCCGWALTELYLVWLSLPGSFTFNVRRFVKASYIYVEHLLRMGKGKINFPPLLINFFFRVYWKNVIAGLLFFEWWSGSCPSIYLPYFWTHQSVNKFRQWQWKVMKKAIAKIKRGTGLCTLLI